MMRLCFLQERRYAPYLKWLGTAFSRLEAAADVTPLLQGVLDAGEGGDREDYLGRAYEAVAHRHNDLRITKPLDPGTGPYDVKIAGVVRPFRVLNANRFVGACCEALEDERLQELPVLGSVDQLMEQTDLLINFSDWPLRLEAYYAESLDRAVQP